MFCAVDTSFHRGLDFHVDAPGLAPAHGMEMELTRSAVATDGRSAASPTNVAFSRAKAWQEFFYPAGLSPSVDASDRLHFFWMREN